MNVIISAIEDLIYSKKQSIKYTQEEMYRLQQQLNTYKTDVWNLERELEQLKRDNEPKAVQNERN